MLPLLHRVLLSRWVLTAVGTLCLVVAVWLLGPLLPWLEGPAPRLILAGLMLVSWIGANLLLDFRRQARDAAAPGGGWGTFLRRLGRPRPRQPLNGVIIAFALNDIAQARPEECLPHARAVRTRIAELETCFGQPVPAYLVFTKADLIAG